MPTAAAWAGQESDLPSGAGLISEALEHIEVAAEQLAALHGGIRAHPGDSGS